MDVPLYLSLKLAHGANAFDILKQFGIAGAPEEVFYGPGYMRISLGAISTGKILELSPPTLHRWQKTMARHQ
jgi:hypothetical protein